MKHCITFLLASSLVFALTRGLLAQVPEESRPAGRVLVLDNENVLEGKIERLGDLYVISQDGGEVRVPATRALIVCASLQDAYKFLSHRINTRDGDELLRLARWCQLHGLPNEAIAEAKAALVLRPNHGPTKQLLTMVEQASLAAADKPKPEAQRPQPPLPAPVEVTADCLAAFSSQIQPILMNTCACCHATGKGGSFVLMRSNDAVAWRATQINLASTIGQISFDRPAASPLLTKAACAHGGSSQAPLPPALAVALSSLQRWAIWTAAENPQLKSRGAASVAEGPPPQTNKAPEAPVATAVPMASAVPVGLPSGVPIEGAAQQPAEAREVSFFSGVTTVRPVAMSAASAKTQPNGARPPQANTMAFVPAPGPAAGEFRALAANEADAPPFQPSDPFDAGIFNRMEKTTPPQ
jgi:hypothetical protein